MSTEAFVNSRFLITGGSSGIGLAVARQVCQLGATAILVGRNAERLQAAAACLPPEKVLLEPFDLRDCESIPGWLTGLSSRLGPLSGLAHCAGVHRFSPLTRLNPEHISDLFKVNVFSAIWLASGFAKKGCAVPGSSLVLVSSVASARGSPGMAVYGASKAAVLGLVPTLAAELAPKRIRVNCVVPGMVETPMLEGIRKSMLDSQFSRMQEAHPLGFGTPEDVAGAILYLLGPEAKWVTGSVLTVDGGFMVH